MGSIPRLSLPVNILSRCRVTQTKQKTIFLLLKILCLVYTLAKLFRQLSRVTFKETALLPARCKYVKCIANCRNCNAKFDFQKKKKKKKAGTTAENRKLNRN